MHANLNTNLFYDLVLLIECSNWICACPSGWPCLQVTPPIVAYVLPECRFISIPVNFRHSICPILAKVMPDFSVNFCMACARICRKYRVPRICVLSILLVVFDRFSINVSTMNIGNV